MTKPRKNRGSWWLALSRAGMLFLLVRWAPPVMVTVSDWIDLARFLASPTLRAVPFRIETARSIVEAVALLGAGRVLRSGCESLRRPNRCLIPAGYVGWTTVKYGVKGAPALSIENGFYLTRFPASGRLQTSSVMRYGWARDEYYYYSGAKRWPLRMTGWEEGGMMWGGHTAGSPQSNDPVFASVPWSVAEGFFVGTEVQFKDSWFLSAHPSRVEQEFHDFGMRRG